MSRFFALMLAAGLALLAAGAARAAPKKAAEPMPACAAGAPKPVCCKAFVADHCIYISCCEVGNAGFFTQTECPTCLGRAAERAEQARRAASKPGCGEAAKAGCSGTGACGEACAAGTQAGNGAFFTPPASEAPTRKSAKPAVAGKASPRTQSRTSE
jgi:hypothetical protein